MSLCLRAQTALAEDQNSDPTTCVRWLTAIFRGSYFFLSVPPPSLSTHTHFKLMKITLKRKNVSHIKCWKANANSFNETLIVNYKSLLGLSHCDWGNLWWERYHKNIIYCNNNLLSVTSLHWHHIPSLHTGQSMGSTAAIGRNGWIEK